MLRHIRFLTAGESHGPRLTIIVEGIPAGVPLRAHDINRDLARRQRGYGRGARQKIERDQADISGGVRYGVTTGAPIALSIANLDWVNWTERMSVEPVDNPAPPVTRMRPGHADLAGALKYGHTDIRNVIERSSSRETAARVAAGAVARCFLAPFGVAIYSRVLAVGGIQAAEDAWLRLRRTGAVDRDVAEYFQRVEESEMRCADLEAEAAMKKAVDDARREGNSLGGVFEVIAYGVPPGLGSYSEWYTRLGARLGAAIMSIQSVKGMEIGGGFSIAAKRGRDVHDVISYDDEIGWYHESNNAGGMVGGISNGEPIVVRVACKPIPTLTRPLPSVDLATRERAPAHVERSDVCVVPAAGVVGEAMVALVLADAFREKFGGDSLAEAMRNYRGYVDSLKPRRALAMQEQW